MPRFRHRSASVGSLQDGQTSLSTNNNINESDKLADLETAKSLLLSLLYIRDRSGKSFLHSNFNLNIAKGLLDRAKSLDDIENKNSKYWQRKFLLQADPESGYTPFHRAVLEGNLSALLLFLRHAMDDGCDRLTQRPMTVLHAAESAPKATTTITGSNFDLAQTMATAKDKEGLTPLELLGKLQKSELTRCRHSLNACRPQVCLRPQRRTRQISFDIGEDHEQLSFLSDNMDILEEQRDCNEKPEIVTSYACEVVTFGRPHHCALGVVQGSSSSSKEDYHSSTFCPQRVQEFSQDRIRRAGSAVAVAAATHHTLVATRNGNLYAFGFGKGGRLGIGDIDNQQCPLPRRVMGPLMRRKVVGVAAAPNHSLAVTKDGILFAWGSNRFGQLGESSNNGGNCRSLPRRVEDMKNIPCIAVAAGEKHSVSLSRKGEVYVWGDNTAGQLGVPRRTGIQKVQRVETLWNGTQPKIAIAIAAAEQSTLVLTCPLRGVTQVNGIYSWGHGSHVPIKVHFENNTRGNDEQERRKSFLSTSRRVVNPVAIASAKYHNVCTTSDGHVYTWGLHAESLGRTNAKTSTKQSHQGNSTSGRSTSSPQLVTGMLPENGGGFAVALSASEQYTAVVTDSGSLYTWGATHGKNILGHEGVRWQPSPKRVPGVHRAVNVAIAKEHTVLLIGASFPAIPKNRGLPSLEYLSARKIAEYVDLFNVVPILIMGERTEVGKRSAKALTKKNSFANFLAHNLSSLAVLFPS